MPQLTLAYRDACDIVTLLTNLTGALRTTSHVAQLLDAQLPESIDRALPRIERALDGFSSLLEGADILPPSEWPLGEFAPVGTPYEYRGLALSAGQYTELLFLLAWAVKASELDLTGAPAVVREPLRYYGKQAGRLLHNLASATGPGAYEPAPELLEAAPPIRMLPKLELASHYTLTLRTHQAVALARELGASATIFGTIVRDGKRRLLTHPNLGPLVKGLESLHARLLAASAPMALAFAHAGIPAPAKVHAADPFQEYQVTFEGPDLHQLVGALEYLRLTYRDLPKEGQMGEMSADILELAAPLKPATDQFYQAAKLAGFPLAAAQAQLD